MKIIALDFDGVLCDSARELAISGYRGAGVVRFRNSFHLPPEKIIDQFISLRPVIKTGYESIILCELILRGVAPKEIKRDFKILGKQVMDEYDLTPKKMITLFGNVRDQWIKNDLSGWLVSHSFYPGVLVTLNTILKKGYHVFIITTKEKRFAIHLLKSHRVKIPESHIFGLNDGEKTEVLRKLIKRFGRREGGTICFVEDRIKTLEAVINDKRLDCVELYLASWGYNTSDQKKNAENNPRIKLLGLDGFTQLI